MIIKEHGNPNKIRDIIMNLEEEPSVEMQCDCGCKFCVDESDCTRAGYSWVTKTIMEDESSCVATVCLKAKCPECNTECFGIIHKEV